MTVPESVYKKFHADRLGNLVDDKENLQCIFYTNLSVTTLSVWPWEFRLDVSKKNIK